MPSATICIPIKVHSGRGRALLLAALAALACNSAWGAGEAQIQLSESELKAALIYNYTQFIEWPATAFALPGSPFQICIVGNPAMRTALMALERRQHHGHPIRVLQPSGREGLASCHVLYIDSPRSLDLGADAGAVLGEAATLTVSSAGDAVEHGFAIGKYITQ